MGCCYSLCKDDAGPQSEDSERTPLLVDPVNSTTNIPRIHSDDYVNQHVSSVPKKTDEQSALNRILHETAANIIDVGALDSHNMEQHEISERSRAYAKRLEVIGVKVPERSLCLLKDIPVPEKTLSAEPLAIADQELKRVRFRMYPKSLTESTKAMSSSSTLS
ncbi:ragulator complex protein LAMTOR1 isoform X2 [Belonocnema kinseyi]|uniref:ragulator complex protein LAMTOR1 isoform X2 n=1 Tax=Belonocnema kinseyi TaxID=2817044 RepID=UPI00143DDDFA|nr:ragulator complex protein LAMTOR1 isoform X2 [Belonocnema kinseyi]